MTEIRVVDIQQETEIAAPRQRVFAAIVDEMSFWCGPPFTHSPEANELVIEKRVGGKFIEQCIDASQGYLWGTVSAFIENRVIEFIGPLGMSGVVTGRVTYELSDSIRGTSVKLKHQAMGVISDDTLSGFRFGWRELLNRRLKNYIERNEITGLKLNRAEK